jgi:hypothetical protein
MQLIRKPTKKELALLEFLVEMSSIPIEKDWQENLLVKSMDDGGMGSLLLFPKGIIKYDRKFGYQASEKKIKDSDGIELIASLYLDQKGKIFELDIWKVNFSETLVLKDSHADKIRK